MNAAGAFGLFLVLVWLFRARSESSEAKPRALERADAWMLAGIAALVAVAYVRVAGSYFLSDDFVLLHHAGEYRQNAWWAFTHPGGDGFYRPLVYLINGITELVAGTSPVAWHSIGLALHVTNCWLVFLLAGALGYTRLASGLASALFAAHGTRPEVAVWVAGRFDLVAAFFALAALVLFLRGWRWMALAAMVLGIFSKESAYAIPLMLTIVAWRRWRHIIPFWVVAAVLFAWRWWLIGGIGGYVDSGGRSEILATGAMGVVKGMGLRLWGTLFFPVNWSARPGLLLAAALAGYVAVLLWSMREKLARTAVAIPVALVLAAALPTFHRLLIGADLLNARYLYLSSIGFCLLLAAMANRAWIAAVVLVFSIAALEHNLTIWKDVSVRAESTCRTAAAAVRSPDDRIAVVGLPRILDGVFFFQNGFGECVAMHTAIAPNRIVLLDRAPDPAGYTTILFWNDSSRAIESK